MRTRITVMLIAALLLAGFVMAQRHPYVNRQHYPEIGKPIYNFTIKDVRNYPTKEIRLHDLKGRNIILDFWHKECVACIRSFPKMNELHKKFKNDVTIIIVGMEDNTNRIRDIYKTFQEKYNLEMVHAFDSMAFWNISQSGSAPKLIYIDKKGIVQAVTSSASEEQIAAFIKGEPFEFKNTSYSASLVRDYDNSKPYLVDGNGGDSDNFLYRSLLAKYERGMPWGGTSGTVERTLSYTNLLQGTFSLKRLYWLAYTGIEDWMYSDSSYGKVYPYPVLELKDTTEFILDPDNYKGYYWYSLRVPKAKANKKHVMETIQRDLKTYFDYDVSFETRSMPCWKLVASEKAKTAYLSKTTDRKNAFYDYHGYNLVNITINSFIAATFSATGTGYDIPIIDETGITGRIDIELKNITMNNWDAVVAAIREKGFDVIKSEHPMRVMVLRDAVE